MKGFYSLEMSFVLIGVLTVTLMGGIASADFVFGEPINLGPTVNSPCSDGVPRITADGLELYFNSNRSGGYGNYDVWVSTRETADSDWGEPMNLGSTINSSAVDGGPSISADGLTLFFESRRPGGYGNNDLYVTTRQTSDDTFGPPVNLGPLVNSSARDQTPDISADGLSLFFMSNRPGGSGGDNVWFTTRETTHGEWSAPVNLGPNVNGSGQAGFPYISDDGLLLFFASIRAGGYGAVDIWLAKRSTKDDAWGVPVNLGPVINSSKDELAVCISSDGSTLFFSSRRSGGVGDQDIWQVPIIPVVDFNGDGKVDSADMAIMLYHWGQNEPLCDIAPMPWGDGVVDIEDLIVLAEHLEPGLECVAHWTLDESRGAFTQDSVGDSDAVVLGGATWRPDEGIVDGALQLDGIDAHVSTEFVSDPKLRPVRVACWINTDVPGKVIVSQTAGATFGSTWLGTDPTDGTLMTGMMFPVPALPSTTVVADGQWHEVAIDWDGAYRRLWVDQQEIAKDAQPLVLPPFNWTGALNLGAGAGLEPDTFFSGLIDDVRIYNRAVKP